MITLDDSVIRSSFVNASRKEVSSATLPDGLDAVDWERLDYFGWRDPRLPLRAYVVIPLLDGRLVGIVLQRAGTTPTSRALCSWCRDVTLPNEVVLYTARRTGPSGRKGDAVGVLLCEDFQCSHNVRRLPPLAYPGFDREAARQRRIEDLMLLSATFAEEL